MKRNLFLMGTLALIAAGGIFWSCQKEELPAPEEGALKGAKINSVAAVFGMPADPVCYGEEVTISFYVGENVNCGKVRLDVLKPSGLEVDWTVKELEDVTPVDGYVTYSFIPDELGNYKFRATSAEDNDKGDKCGVALSGWIESEVLVVEECADCTWEGESAWSEGNPYNADGKGNWAMYTAYAPGTVKLLAGQDMEAGEVTFSEITDGKVTITITVNDGWRLKDTDESVKIEGYNEAPLGNPSPGQFTYKGTNPEIEVETFTYYGIHLDVEECR